MMYTYPPVAFPPPPPTSNTLSSNERSALVRSSRKLYKVLGDVPRVLDEDVPPLPSRSSTPSSLLALNPDTESAWRKRKPTHLPPLLKFCSGTLDVPDSPDSTKSPVYHRPPSRCGSVLSVSPSIISNAPSTASGMSHASASSDSTQRRTKLERLRRKLGHDVPATAVFPTTSAAPAAPTTTTPAAAPRTPRGSSSSKKASRARTRSIVRQPDARSIAFSISSDESVHRVTFTSRVRSSSPRPPKTKHVHVGALPPIPSIPAHLLGDGDETGLLRPRPKMAAGSLIGGEEFKAARRAIREGRFQNGMAEPGELVEMVGFLH